MIIRIVDLPAGVPAFTLPDIDGWYNVYINAKLDTASRQRALEHEMEHIRINDWSRLDAGMSVFDIEREVGA